MQADTDYTVSTLDRTMHWITWNNALDNLDTLLHVTLIRFFGVALVVLDNEAVLAAAGLLTRLLIVFALRLLDDELVRVRVLLAVLLDGLLNLLVPSHVLVILGGGAR